MRRFGLLAIALLAPLSAAPSSTSEPVLKPTCGGPFQLCGYKTPDSDEPLIPRRFEVAQPFSEGLAAVRIDGLFGFINEHGEVVIAPRFEAAGSFSEGYAEVRIGNASGAIDRSGQLVVPAKFQRLLHFHDGTFIAEPLAEVRSMQNVDYRHLDTLKSSITLTSIRGAGLYHRAKGWLTEQDLRFSIFDEPRRGLIWAARRGQEGGEQWGLLRADGSWKVSPRYEHVQKISETHAVVNGPTQPQLPPIERRETVRWGAVDRNGELVVPLQFEYLSYWRGGYGYAKEGKPYTNNLPNEVREGIVKSDGSLLAGRYFDKVDIREEGTLPRARLGDRWFSITPSGELIADQADGEPLVECESGLGIFRSGDDVQFRMKGRAVGQFDNTYFLARDCPGPFNARRGKNWFFVLENGTVLGGAEGFENTNSFSGQHAPVMVGGKWGIINRSGDFSVKPRFSTLRRDGNNTFAVSEGKETFWISASGERVAQPIAKRPSPTEALTCAGGLRFFQKGDLWGLQDQTGQTVIEPRFRALSCFKQGVTWAAEPGGSGWCALGPDGKRRDKMNCRKTYYPYSLSHHYPEPFDEDRFESSVLWNRAMLDYQAGKRDEAPKWVGDGVRGRGSYSTMNTEQGALGEPIDEPTVISDAGLKLGAVGIVALLFTGAGVKIWKRQAKASA
jgi:hypothetical protein